jgi:hypothetical protein
MRRELACIVLVALGACDQGQKPRDRREAIRVAFAKMEEFTAKMCACKDMKCAQRVSDEMTNWSVAQAKQQPEPPRFSDEETIRAAAIGERMGKCMQVAMSADLGLTLTELEPTTGDADGGLPVHIHGTGFTQDVSRSVTVYFGEKQGHFIRFLGDGELIAATPRGVTGTVDVKVIFDPGGEKVLPGAFTFVAGK